MYKWARLTTLISVLFLRSGLDKLRAWWWACTQHTLNEVIACTKLRPHKSTKTPLGSTPMLFKKVSYFCVWKQLILGTISLTFIISFSWEAVVTCSYMLCSTCENNFNSTHLKLILNCMWFHLLRDVKDLQ